jgi:hypothetical protein
MIAILHEYGGSQLPAVSGYCALESEFNDHQC